MPNELIINCRITSASGSVISEFSVDHNNHHERRHLGARCASAFSEGHMVTTWPDGVGFDDRSAITNKAA